MGKKKKKKDKKVKVKKHTSGVEERAKSIQNIAPPDENPYKKDNENGIDRYFKFGMPRHKYRSTPREEAKLANRQHRPKKKKSF